MPPNIRQQLAIYNSLLKHVSVLFLRSLISMSYNTLLFSGRLCSHFLCILHHALERQLCIRVHVRS